MKTGTMVHYVSLGSRDGQYESTCRAAIITEPSQGDTDATLAACLAVLSPNGMFFDHEIPYDAAPNPGTWHHAEECVS